jgi:hypothetical protein
MDNPREVSIFSDASFDPKLKIGVGAILIISDPHEFETFDPQHLDIQTRLIEEPNIARLELTTLLWAVDVFNETPAASFHPNLNLFTDCRGVSNLLERRAKLEKKFFKSNRTGELLSNADLYQRFYRMVDAMHPSITWMQGHAAASTIEHDPVQRIFSYVDKESRRVMRNYRDNF